MLIIVTRPEQLDNGKLGGTFYTLPESRDDALRFGEYNALVEEAKEIGLRDKYGESLAQAAAYRKLMVILERADFINIDTLLKPEYRYSRVYALKMLGFLFKGNLPRKLLKQFTQRTLNRIQKARYAMKELHSKGTAARWADRVERGLAS